MNYLKAYSCTKAICCTSALFLIVTNAAALSQSGSTFSARLATEVCKNAQYGSIRQSLKNVLTREAESPKSKLSAGGDQLVIEIVRYTMDECPDKFTEEDVEKLSNGIKKVNQGAQGGNCSQHGACLNSEAMQNFGKSSSGCINSTDPVTGESRSWCP